MSFRVRCERTGLEYNGTSLNTLFAQRRNLLRPSFLGMVRDILRFNREAPALLATAERRAAARRVPRAGRYGRAFVEHYIVPMGAAIWSTDPRAMLDFPGALLRALPAQPRHAHRGRPAGVAHRQRRLGALRRAARPRRSATASAWTRRSSRSGACPGGVIVKRARHEADRFDAVFLACHSDQALALLADPSGAEREVLGAIPYQRNEAVLHTDTPPAAAAAPGLGGVELPPAARRAAPVALTYHMNILQRLDAPRAVPASR